MNDSMTIKVGGREIYLNRRKELPDGEVIFNACPLWPSTVPLIEINRADLSDYSGTAEGSVKMKRYLK